MDQNYPGQQYPGYQGHSGYSAQPAYGYPPAPPGPGVAPPSPVAPPRGDPPGYYMGYRLGSWGARVGALLVDGLIAAGPAVVGLILGALLGAFDTPTITAPPPPALGQPGTVPVAPEIAVSGGPSGIGLLVLWLGYLASAGLSLYNRVFREGKTGQGWGKQALRLRLVSMRDGRPLGPGMAFVRGIAHTVDGLSFYVGYLWPLWDDRRQTFADKICSTVVLADADPGR